MSQRYKLRIMSLYETGIKLGWYTRIELARIPSQGIMRPLHQYHHSKEHLLSNMEPVDGIEPSSQLYQSRILPLNYTGKFSLGQIVYN